MQSLLRTTETQGAVSEIGVTGFIKKMKAGKKQLFHKDDVPKGNDVSQIHAVCLQMIVRGMIALKVRDSTKLGTEKLGKKHISVICPSGKRKVGDHMCWSPGYMLDELWEGFNLSS